MSEKNMWKQENLTCKPLDSLEEISSFLQDPPSWRSLCIEINRHSDRAVKNIEINKYFGENQPENPQTFCHFDPDAEEVIERHSREELPKTLVCHDMANGYHDDCVIDGTGNYGAYTFYNWAAIDIFCYFSHHFITIPPLGWINVGHAHGVKVIGTVITEWSDGVALWDKILRSETDWRHFASALVAIAKTLRFDGWLLNIENKISKPGVLLQFVRHLHELLHQELEAPLLVWYDSVTVEGNLSWQNGLNDKNLAFFEASDALFTNYSWSEAEVAESARRAREAGRAHALFLGIDVWGRNFFGGGHFNTQEAVRVAHEHGCSLAIFAPAWTHEAMVEEVEGVEDSNAVVNGGELEPFERFLLRDRAFWVSLWPFLCTKLPHRLPFRTSFCRGQGKKRRLYGEVICPVPWYNLQHMQYQPNCSLGPHGYLLSRGPPGVLQRGRRHLGGSRVELVGDEANEADEADAAAEAQEQRAAIKRKMKDAYLHLFKVKAAKAEVTGGSEKSVEDVARTPEVNGTSTVQASVKSQTGDKTGKTRYFLVYMPTELECLEQFYEDSFLGGSCLKVNPSDEVDPEHRTSRILLCDFESKNSLIVCVVTKNLVGHEAQYLNIRLTLTEEGGGCRRVVLVGRSSSQGGMEMSTRDALAVYPMSSASDLGFKELQTYLVLNEPDFYVPVANAFGWQVRYYELSSLGARVSAVSVRTGLPRGPVLLGHFALCTR